MAKIKMSKKAASIDMTAMCDVAFLLLTFFILTATAKVPEPISVDTPSSTVKTKLPETNLVTITVGKGKENMFVDIKGRELRKTTLELMGQKYGVTFTDAEKEQFSLMESFGVPIQNMSQIIKMKSAERNKQGLQPGVPYDTIVGSTTNQLKDWIYTARQANIELGNDKELNFAIKGDAKLEYPKVKIVMDIFQDQKINTFDLVTGLRGKNF